MKLLSEVSSLGLDEVLNNNQSLIMKKLIQEALQELGEQRKFFFSEDDFKLALALAISLKGAGKLDVRLEVPSRKEIKFIDRRGKEHLKTMYLDMLIVEKNQQRRYPIELKYKTKFSFYSDPFGGEEPITLRNHSARDVSRYNFRKDIYRIEKLREDPSVEKGFVIFLTNEPKFWQDEIDGINMDGNYRMKSTISQKDKGWIMDSLYVNKYYFFDKTSGHFFSKNDPQKMHWTQTGEHNYDLPLKKEYAADWRDFSKMGEDPFRYLMIEI